MIGRRFLPLLLAAGSAAFNVNLLQNALLIVAAHQSAAWSQMSPQLLAKVAAGLFMAPFVMFSGIAAQLAQRHDKARILKCLMALEIGIMVMTAAGLAEHHLSLLLAALFLMGLHSTFFTPATYALLPQVLQSDELVGGNALRETATVLALLFASLTAGSAAVRSDGRVIGDVLLSIAVAGLLISLAIPASGAAAPGLRIDWNPLTSTLDNIKAARESRAVLLSVLGLSWFWAYGAFVLGQLPLYCHATLHGTGPVVTLTIVLFSFGVGIGSLLCERLSGGRMEIGLVPFGSFGLTVFALDWVWGTPRVDPARVIDVAALMAMPGGWRVLFDIAAMGVCGGLFVVPLHALIQQRSSACSLPRISGANNLLNIVFIGTASLLVEAGLARGLTVPELIVVAALLNAAVALYIYQLVPEFLLRFVCYVLVHVLYRLRRSGSGTFPETGAALIVSNHVTFVDALVISAACRRPVHFVMDAAIFNAPVIRTLARGMKAIPIASAREDAAVLEHAFELTAAALRNGDLVCIFPEGRLTRDGLIGGFRPGLMRILRETPVPVVPIAIVGLWGSLFSKQAARVWQRLPRRLGARIAVNVGDVVSPMEASPEQLRRCVQVLYDRGLSEVLVRHRPAGVD